MSPWCARCGGWIAPGDLVTEVRVVTSPEVPGQLGGDLATDRTDRLAHVTCPE